jgi:hypothetical protein
MDVTDPLEPWSICWRTVAHRMPEFDSLAQTSIAYLLYDNRDRGLTYDAVPETLRGMPVMRHAILTYIQRSY